MATSSNSRIKIAVPLLFAGALIGGYTLSRLQRKAALKKIEGKTYVVLGASSGIGRGVAEELGKLNANVVIAARRAELLEEVASTIRASGGNALVVPMDITKPEEVQRVMDMAMEEYGTIDVWVNMPGLGAMGRFWEIPPEDQARIVEINLTGFIYANHIILQQFIKQGYGVLINTGSVDSEVGQAYLATYSATKAGVKYLSLALNQELRLSGYKNIDVVTIEPWAIDTPFWAHSANYTGKEPKFAMMDEPQKVVKAILYSSICPRKIVKVGWKVKFAYFMAHLFPRFQEWFTANVAHKYQIEMPPKAPDTTGAIYEPMEEGREVEAGIDERFKEKGV